MGARGGSFYRWTLCKDQRLIPSQNTKKPAHPLGQAGRWRQKPRRDGDLLFGWYGERRLQFITAGLTIPTVTDSRQ